MNIKAVRVLLKSKQKALAELMILKPELTNEEYAKEIGINPKTLYKWKKTVEFNEYLDELCKEKFNDMERLALEKLKAQLKKGNWKAIEYVLNGLGYKPEDKLDIKNSGDINITITGDEE